MAQQYKCCQCDDENWPRNHLDFELVLGFCSSSDEKITAGKFSAQGVFGASTTQFLSAEFVRSIDPVVMLEHYRMHL